LQYSHFQEGYDANALLFFRTIDIEPELNSMCLTESFSGKHIPVLFLLFLALAASALAIAQTPIPTPATPQAAGTSPAELENAPVVFDGDVLYSVKGSLGLLPVEDRAQAVARFIKRLAEDPFFDPDSVTIEEENGASQMMYRGQLLARITEEDATLNGRPRRTLAAERLQIVRDAIHRYRERRTPAAFHRTAIYSIVGAALLILIFFGLRKLHRFLMVRVERQCAAGTGIRFQQKELVGAKRLAVYKRRLIKALEWGCAIILAFIYLQFVFSIFPLTRSLALGTLRYILDPLNSLWQGVLFHLNGIFFIAVIVVIVRYILKALKWVHAEAAAGNIHFPGVQREWAFPAYRLLRLGVLAFAAVIIYPYIPGSDTAAFKSISLFTGVVISLGSTGIAGQFMGGLVLMSMKPFGIGDFVQVGGVTGVVVGLSMSFTRIRTIKNEEVTVPNSQVLSSNLVNYTTLAAKDGLILHTSVTIGYDAPWRTIHELLIRAALKTEGILPAPAPFVLQTALNDFYVTYEINAYTRDANHMANLYAGLHQNIQDSFNEAGVEIMSAHYSYLRDGNAIAIPDNYRPEGYAKPSFGVSLEKKDGEKRS
jgi:small-conductance mechanosensitive channel